MKLSEQRLDKTAIGYLARLKMQIESTANIGIRERLMNASREWSYCVQHPMDMTTRLHQDFKGCLVIAVEKEIEYLLIGRYAVGCLRPTWVILSRSHEIKQPPKIHLNSYRV